MKNILKLLYIILLLQFSGYSHSVPIASYDHHFAGGQSGPDFNYLDFYIQDRDRTAKLFDDVVFGVEHIGNTFSANSVSDSNFNYFSQLFTNGIEDSFWLTQLFSQDLSGGGSGGGSLKSEGNLFYGSSGLGDLNGYTITSIDLTVNNVAFYKNYPLTFSGRLINFWSESDITLTVHGTPISVPEPSILSLLLFGVLGITLNKMLTNSSSGHKTRR